MDWTECSRSAPRQKPSPPPPRPVTAPCPPALLLRASLLMGMSAVTRRQEEGDSGAVQTRLGAAGPVTDPNPSMVHGVPVPSGALCVPRVRHPSLVPRAQWIGRGSPAAGVRVLVFGKRASGTLRNAGFCLFSGPSVTGLHPANCSQRKTACRNKSPGRSTLPGWPCVRHGSRIPGWVWGPPITRVLGLRNLLPSLLPPSLQHPSKQVSPPWAWRPPQGERLCSQSVEVLRPLGVGGSIYLFLSHTNASFCGGGLMPRAKGLKPCSVHSESCIPQI